MFGLPRRALGSALGDEIRPYGLCFATTGRPETAFLQGCNDGRLRAAGKTFEEGFAVRTFANVEARGLFSGRDAAPHPAPAPWFGVEMTGQPFGRSVRRKHRAPESMRCAELKLQALSREGGC